MKTYLVYGNDSNGKGVILEIVAEDMAQALEQARLVRSDCKFNHVNLK